MALMAPTDAMFLLAETRDVPTHVGGLQIYESPEGVGRAHAHEVYEWLLSFDELRPMFRQRPRRSLTTLGQWTWVDDDVDLEYHVRHSALPEPGRVRELLALGSRLHSSLLDRHRPLWEFHLIEGLEGNRFAAYTKIHHALVDGISALRLLQQSMSEEPDGEARPPWAARPRSGDGGGGIPDPRDVVSGAASALRELAGVGPSLVRTAQRSVQDQLAAYPFQAPPSMLNVGITGSRRFAADGWSLERVRQVGRAAGATVNDVILAMCGGALRRYLLDEGELPDAPLIAMVPVSLRGDDDVGGNAVGAVLCNLGTDLEDEEARLDRVHSSMEHAKRNLGGLSQLQATLLSAGVMAPMALLSMLGGGRGLRPAFNVIISNVPGPRAPLWFNGARLQGIYPMSVPTHGQALNITITSYVDDLQFGLTGCRRSVPHLQRLLAHLDSSLEDLEKAVA